MQKSDKKKHVNKNLITSAEDKQKFQTSNKCCIFDKLFDVGDNKVREHYYMTGKYRGYAHRSYNIYLTLTKKVLVIFHNLKGYEGHLIIREIDQFDVKLSVITHVLETYVAFTVNKILVFIDKMQFINSSLDLLVKNLSYNDLKYLSQEFSGDLLELLKQKGVYPYEYMDSIKKFFDEKLPDRCKFFSSLKDKSVSEKDYSNATNVWNTFKINTMGDYHDLYSKSDALLLADVFKKFINEYLEYCKLDICHYFSSPRLIWDT